RHRHVALARPDQAGDAPPRGLELPDPVLPGRTVLVPVGQVAVVGRAHRVRERALRAAVDVDAPLEDGEAVANPGRERVDAGSSSGQGRPSGGPRAGSET